MRLGSEVKGGREERERKRKRKGEKGEGRRRQQSIYRYGVVSSVITLEAATALK